MSAITTSRPESAEMLHSVGISPNPFRSGESSGSGSAPGAIVIFGASGDLTKRKLLPALYALRHEKLTDSYNPVIGFARSEKTHEAFRAEVDESVSSFARFKGPEQNCRAAFVADSYYHTGDYSDSAAYKRLAVFLDELDKRHHTKRNTLFYLATPPNSFAPILANLKASGLVADDEREVWRRVIVEKPLGVDRSSARDLNEQIHRSFPESKVFRIDHYLGKETIQNILAFRFGNGIFEPLWNRRYIDHVQITVAESIGVGSRIGYFDGAGITRDMLQSHILQLLTLIAMEPPGAFVGEAIRDEKVKVLRSIRPYDHLQAIRNVVRAQYKAGVVDGASVRGYQDEEQSVANSETETYLSLKLEIDNWRWSGVPFYIRTGKRLAKRVSEVKIVYRKPPLALFEQFGSGEPEQNVLGFRIQPEEGITLSFVSKRPGPSFRVDPVHMDFQYRTSFAKSSPEAYERLILDAINGDPSLFAREDEVDLSWRLVDPIIATFKGENPAPLYHYESGSWGPDEANFLLERSGRQWLRL